MPVVSLSGSPLCSDIEPVPIFYREFGSGPPLVFLHGGWGYEVYPFDRQIQALGDRFRILIPDRTGYGRSPHIDTLPLNFHQLAAHEMVAVLNELSIRNAILWGHSDGAVIAALMGLADPNRYPAVILEAFHYSRAKIGSLDFFRMMTEDPDSIGGRTREALVRDHGERRWRDVLRMNGEVWQRIVQSGLNGEPDLFDGRLSQLRSPVLFLHGARDPRTEPGDLEKFREQLPAARLELLAEGGHSPHSESATAAEVTHIAQDFLSA